MKDKSILIIIAVVVLGVLAIGSGLRPVPISENPWFRVNVSTRSDAAIVHRTVDASGATAAAVTLEQSVGDMRVQGTPATLLSATFDTRPKEWLPTVTYSVDGTQGALVVTQPEPPHTTLGDTRNTWQVSLSETMPIDLTLKRGVGEGTIDLSRIDVSALHATLGVGETTIDLSGPRPHGVAVSVDGGVGSVTLIVPSGVSVRVIAEKGIGGLEAPGFTRNGSEWVNAAYSTAGPTVDVRVTQGIGEVRVESKP